jgi:hypothetical protein
MVLEVINALTSYWLEIIKVNGEKGGNQSSRYRQQGKAH